MVSNSAPGTLPYNSSAAASSKSGSRECAKLSGPGRDFDLDKGVEADALYGGGNDGRDTLDLAGSHKAEGTRPITRVCDA